jgi:hypothetical protein
LYPECLEEFRKDILLDLGRCNTLSYCTLLDDLQDNLFHFLNENDGNLFCVVQGVFIHMRNDEANGFKESHETFTTMETDTEP